jgi:hypothetical protein
MVRRTGTTLLEVLIAIFVTGIGLLALLALFPLGAVNMALAIKEDRCAHSCADADAVAHMTIFRDGTGALVDLRHEANIQTAFVGPIFTLPALSNPYGPSYPVLADPLGAYSYSAGGGAGEVGAQTATLGIPGVPRINPAFSAALALQFCTLSDDINFGIPSNGTPVNVVGGTLPGSVQRDDQYTWAYLLRKQYVTANTIDLSIVVFKKRGLQVGTGLQPLDETACKAQYGAYGDRVITLRWDPTSQQKPRVSKGTWILDSTMQGTPRGYFYRVVNVTDVTDSAGDRMDCEVQTALKATSGTGIDQAVVMESVAEVFERGTK